MKKIILYSILIFSTLAFADGQFTLLQTIPAKAEQFTTDPLGNFYLIKNDVLEKYNGEGILLKTYSNKTFGKIDLVDASNPMKVLLFYKNFSQVLFLDNTLSLNGEPVSIEQLGIHQSPVICSSYNNGMWIYDPQNFELVRYDENLQKTQSTGNISQLIGITLSPNFLMEYNSKIYLNDPEIGFLFFDIYGTYFKTFPIKHLSNFQGNGPSVLYLKKNYLINFTLKTMAQDSFLLPDSTAISSRVDRNRLFLLSEKDLRIYKTSK